MQGAGAGADSFTTTPRLAAARRVNCAHSAQRILELVILYIIVLLQSSRRLFGKLSPVITRSQAHGTLPSPRMGICHSQVRVVDLQPTLRRKAAA